MLDGTKERQGDFVFTAQSIGEYSFCFNNEMSTFAEKMVDFEIAVRCLHSANPQHEQQHKLRISQFPPYFLPGWLGITLTLISSGRK